MSHRTTVLWLSCCVLLFLAATPILVARPSEVGSNYAYLAMVFGFQPTPSPTPALPSPTFNECRADPHPEAAPNYPVQIIRIEKVGETVWLQNTSTTAVVVDGWHLCSITGHQEQQGVSGTLASGETRKFVNPVGHIWSNNQRDDGALYDPLGRLVSYYVDS